MKVDSKLLRLCELVYSTGKWTKYSTILAVDVKHAKTLKKLIKTCDYVWVPSSIVTKVFNYLKYERNIDVTIKDVKCLLFSMEELKLCNFQEKPGFLGLKPLLNDMGRIIIGDEIGEIRIKLENKDFLVWVG